MFLGEVYKQRLRDLKISTPDKDGIALFAWGLARIRTRLMLGYLASDKPSFESDTPGLQGKWVLVSPRETTEEQEQPRSLVYTNPGLRLFMRVSRDPLYRLELEERIQKWQIGEHLRLGDSWVRKVGGTHVFGKPALVFPNWGAVNLFEIEQEFGRSVKMPAILGMADLVKMDLIQKFGVIYFDNQLPNFGARNFGNRIEVAILDLGGEGMLGVPAAKNYDTWKIFDWGNYESDIGRLIPNHMTESMNLAIAWREKNNLPPISGSIWRGHDKFQWTFELLGEREGIPRMSLQAWDSEKRYMTNQMISEAGLNIDIKLLNELFRQIQIEWGDHKELLRVILNSFGQEYFTVLSSNVEKLEQLGYGYNRNYEISFVVRKTGRGGENMK